MSELWGGLRHPIASCDGISGRALSMADQQVIKEQRPSLVQGSLASSFWVMPLSIFSSHAGTLPVSVAK